MTQASTDPRAADPRLRGRTYAIPFERVWTAALAVAGSGRAGALPRWRVLTADDEVGVIEAEATSLVRRRPCPVRIRVSLDENAQTRVDLVARFEGRDWGGNARRIARFTAALDDALAVAPGQILDPTLQARLVG